MQFGQFMAQAGSSEMNVYHYARMQMLSVEETLEGNQVRLPITAGRHELQPSLMAA